MCRRNALVSLLAAALLMLAGPVLAREVSGKIAADSVWSGEVTLAAAVIVEPGATLTVAPGTVVRPAVPGAKLVVRGLLQVEGSKDSPVSFAPLAGWKGIEFMEAPAGSVLSYARFAGAEAAVSSIATPFTLRSCTFRDCATAVKLLREAEPLIERCLFAGNEIAIDNEMKSAPTIRGNLFRGQGKTAILASHNSKGLIEGNAFEKNKQAIGLLQKYTDRIAGNTFTDNEAAIFCNQTQSTPLIERNTFERNENALINFSFSYPVVQDNTFVGNGTAIRNDQFGSPRVVRNLLRDNGTAIYSNRKSNPTVEQNRIEGNDLALFCDYSSYPTVKDNNFLGNRMGVELGIFQSADWEKRSGSKGIVQQEAAARRSQNPLLAKAPTEFRDVVDVSGNWWGDDTARLEAAGAEGNLPFFFDRLDKPQVTYEGFGPESYTLDRVGFAPWLAAPAAGAGPQGVR